MLALPNHAAALWLKSTQTNLSLLSSTENKPPQLIPIGTVVGVFGVDGRMKILPTTHFIERFDPGQILYINKKEYKVNWCGWHKGQARIKLAGINEPAVVETLIGKIVSANAEIRPKLDDDEFYTGDLIGLLAIDQNAVEIGKVDQVITGPAQDLLVIGEVLIPVVKKFVTKIDLENGKIHLDLIPGMLPGSDPDEIEAAKPKPRSNNRYNRRRKNETQ